ncbi:MAG: peptidase T [Gammaproteobacteria bacterium]|nr:peptidase T [Gammaproteobacteria bacterium]
MDIIKRFLNYTKFETTSNEESNTFPSSDKELLLLDYLKKELEDLGVNATFKDGYVYGKLKSDCGIKDTLFLMSHVDTSPEASGKDVNPRIVHFDGCDIELGNGKVLSMKDFPVMKYSIGHDLIVTDGTTLLGADDKSGCALIIDLIERLKERGNYPNVIACFTPDEEIGRGTERIDVDFIKEGLEGEIIAYTVDGGPLMVFNSETFNAASAKVTFKGRSVHPSIGKGVLVNASEVLMRFHKLLPSLERPEYTSDYEPFIHLVGMSGTIEEAHASYIIRNFDLKDLERQKKDFFKARDKVNKYYGEERVIVEIKDTYYNMKEILDKHPKSRDLAKKAYDELGIEFHNMAVRGGTDGATLSFKGIPCPNLATGGENFHGIYEYLDLYEFNKMRDVLLKIADLIR